MANLHPLFRTISVYVIHDRQRDCFLGIETDHWMVISLHQLRDLRLFETASDACDEIGDRPGLEVRELIIDLGAGGPILPGSTASPQASHRAITATY